MRHWILVLLVAGCGGPAERGETCGGGSWRPGTLEIHHLDVGQADATLIVGPTGRTLLVDAGEPRWDGDAGARTIGARLRAVLGCAHLDQVLITHFHVDHLGMPGRGGLWQLVNVQGFTVGKLLHRDSDTIPPRDGPRGPRLRGPASAQFPLLIGEGVGKENVARPTVP